MDDIDIRLLLLQIPGLGNNLVRKILYDYGIIFKDRDYLHYFIEKTYFINSKLLQDEIKKIKEDCYNLGVEIIINNNDTIPNYPLIIYSKGNKLLLVKKNIVSIAGTRTPSKKGMFICRKFTQVAIENNVVLATGFAKGCDRICHNIYIRNLKESIAVLPVGYSAKFDIYTTNNKVLFISEYPPNSKVRKYMFVNRNRIISGISNCLFIPEIKFSGGSYHTIKYANDVGIPIAYGNGKLDLKRCSLKRLKNTYEFDLFIKKSLK